MPLSAGDRLGPYEIVALVGSGGMGEVYRARDTRLDRSVAIKIVGAQVSPLDAGGLEREARAVAALNHPHICALHDVGRDRDTAFLVMEYVAGQTLAARVAHGPIEFREVVRYGIQMAEALDHAHRNGVVHRDLKPSNVMLTKSGVKVLDFGLATLRNGKPVRVGSVDEGASTVKQALSSDSALVGTMHYMAPERLEGQDATVASDIFALGAVMYEMATGRRPFAGSSTAAVIAEILRGDPPAPSTLQPQIPPALDWVIQKCLAKNPDARWQAAGDVVEVLRWIARGGDRAPTGSSSRRYLWPLAGASILLAAALATVSWRSLQREPEPQTLSFAILPPANGGFTPTPSSVPTPQFALSPDGRRITFVAAVAPNAPMLWVRALDSMTATPLAGTQGAEYPFWSPDSASIGFFSNGSLKRAELSGGPVRVLAPTPSGRGGAWSHDGTILFAPTTQGALYRVPAGGGDAVAVTRLDPSKNQASHRWPQFLPDGRHFVYFVQGTTSDAHRIYYADITNAEPPRELLSSRLSASFVRPNYLLFVVEDALMAARFDWAKGRIEGDAFRVVSHVSGSSNFFAAFSASETGLLSYASAEATADLAWYSREGRRMGAPIASGEYVDFRLSPNDTQLAVAEVDPDSHRPDLRVLDLARGSRLRLTYDAATDASPIWSPDGRTIVYRSNRTGLHDLYQKPANGAGQNSVLLQSLAAKYPTDWSPDGRTIIYHTYQRGSGADIWVVNADGSEPRPLVQSTFDEMQGQESPDGRWLAYTSVESGAAEVYIRSISDATMQWQVSAGGGADPRWRGDARELFYLSADGWLMAVTFTDHPSAPRPLFGTHVPPPGDPYLSNYDVAADGQRFLLKVPVHDVTSTPINVVTNWLTAATRVKR